MQIGLVGLPFSGKSTLFQTLSHTHLDEGAAHRQQTNLATVKVPDTRIDGLVGVFQPKKKVYTSTEFVDVIGLKKGDRDSTQFTGAFMTNVKTNDALIHVVRSFDDEFYPHPEGSIDPERDVRILETEFLLADMATIETRVDKLKKQIQKVQDDKLKIELAVLEKGLAHLEKELPLRTLELDPNEKRAIRGYQFLTEKPLLVALNMADDQISQKDALVAKLASTFASAGIAVDGFFGKIELEMSQLPDEDAEVFMADYGLKESALVRIIGAAYRMLGLISFLTFGEDECRAWTIRRGTNAQEAAGAIHTDLMNRFIRAEVVHYDDFMRDGTISVCKEKGHWRLEGKEYIVKDGDMLTIRHG
jgi:GTP-binding protein YchF